jgi:PEGA domain
MRRTLFAVVVMASMTAATSGQGAAPDPAPSGIRPLLGPTWRGYPPPDPPTNWGIPPLIRPPSAPTGLPLSTIGLPLPPTGLQPPGDHDRHGRRQHRRTPVVWSPMVLVVPQALAPAAPAPPPAEVAPVERRPATGRLVLDVQPGSAQVFVDGYYVGTPDDLNASRGELALEPGPHSISLDAPGYEAVSFNVKVAPEQPVVYRRALTSIAPIAPPAAATQAAPRIFYLIPGCYVGNVPPEDAALPPTCDISGTVTFEIR